MEYVQRSQPTYGTLTYTTEKGTKKALLQLIIFYIYLTAVTLVGNALPTHHQHYFTMSLQELLKRTAYTSKNTTISFDTVITIPDFWDYMEFMILPLLHGVVYDESVKWQPSLISNRPTLYGRLFLNESLLLGAPRLRQIRVKSNTCHVHQAFARYYNTCMAAYSADKELTEPFYMGTKFKTMDELNALPIQGRVHTYHSGGYVRPLSYNKDVNMGLIRHLKEIEWLNRGSRVVAFEINMINLNMGLLIGTKLIFEILPTGLINAKYDSKSIYSNPVITSSGGFILGCAVVVYVINFYYTYVEIKKLYLKGYKTFFTIQAVLNIPSIGIIYLSLIYTIYFGIYKRIIDEKINAVTYHFISLDYLILTYSFHENAFGILVFLTWMNLLRFMDFNPVLRNLGVAMQIASADLVAFAVMFLIAFIAYGNLGLLLFGSENEDFRNFPTAFLTMLRLLVTDFDYFQLEHESKILGPIFFLTYILLIFFVIMNMFFSAIVLSYRTATTAVGFQPSFLWYYIRKQLFRVSFGLFKAPRYPEWAAAHELNQPLDESKLEELLLIKENTEIESDLGFLLSRLDMIEDVFYRLHNNIGDIITAAKNQKKRKEKMKPNDNA
ncbi:polycystin-2-like protein 1 isoform X1 [Drosophila virilis]|uniref:polycystin-2-like protein 1 isoform X1 n=2 Tax=Drosophila virilis TaxID=7244 RepID=UPI0013965D35|nr:polycystic kidney disease 2-like 1 protein isoform X1 [Drosophila virilis]